VINLVALRDVPRTPWRNGGGSTQVLLEWPDAQDWWVRISVAQIDRDGDFSAYPGVQRWFAVLLGAGVRLKWGSDLHTLKPGSPALEFDGATAPGCTLIDGPTLDLNLMSLHAAGRALMQAADHQPWHSAAGFRACFTHSAARLQIEAEPPMNLPALCLVWGARSEGQTWALRSEDGPLQAWWMSLETPPSR
jgi:uncharacterized protein